MDFDGWSISAVNIGFKQLFSDKDKIDINALRITSMNYFLYDPSKWTYRDKLYAALSSKQKILLSDNITPQSDAKFSLTCKSENLKQLDLFIFEFDKEEKLLRVDTLNALDKRKDNKWHTYETDNIPLKDVVFLGLRLVADGIDSTYDTKKDFINEVGHVDSTLNESLLLHKLDIYIDGKPIDKYKLDERIVPVHIPDSDIVKLSFDDNNCYRQINELKTKPVIGIGETVHGSETMAKSAVELIKYQVLHNNCKLILLEKMSSDMLLLNRFVQGDETLQIDSIMQTIINPSGSLFNLFSIKQMKELSLWLKEYNKTAKSKVWFLGMDYEYFFLINCFVSMADYLSTINGEIKLKSLDDICNLLLKKRSDEMQQDVSKACEILDSIKPELIKYIGDKEFEIVRYNMRNIVNTYGYNRKSASLRDSIMFENVCFYRNLLCEKDETTIVHAHFLHTTYSDILTYPTLGSYLRNKYGNDYFNIALMAANGYCRTIDFRNDRTALERPRENSIEKYLNNINAEYFYLSTAARNDYVLIRMLGLDSDFDQYRHGYVSLSGRTGGIIFIKDIKATDNERQHRRRPYYEIRADKCRLQIQKRMDSRASKKTMIITASVILPVLIALLCMKIVLKKNIDKNGDN